VSGRRIVAIWWRVLQLGEFYNIERATNLVQGGGGARYIEIPQSMAVETLRFFDHRPPATGDLGFTVNAVPIGSSDGQSWPINIQTKTGKRLRITNQNRQASSNSRHPAWSAPAGFPRAADNVRSRDEASKYFPEGGVRIFIAKLDDDTLVAGFTQGVLPPEISPTSSLRRLYVNSGVGGVLWDVDLPLQRGS
jgi:hypothetical protein